MLLTFETIKPPYAESPLQYVKAADVPPDSLP